MSVDTLRDIIGCTCSFNETYDGKRYNLKTEQYEDCSCIETLPIIHSLLISKLPGKKPLVRDFNSAIDDMRKSIDEMFRSGDE